MDGAIVRFLNSGVGKFPPFDWLMEAIVSDYLVPVAGSLVLLGLWISGTHATRPINQVVSAIGAGSIGLANLLTSIINVQVNRARPFLENDLTLLFYEPTDPSFPSNTAAVGFALATAVFVRHRALGGGLYALAFLWAFSRVYAGVHYSTDMLGGAAIGVASALAVTALFRWLAFVLHYILRALRTVYAA